MSCGDGSGHQLDTGFGVGWSNNLNEGRHLGKTLGTFMGHKFFHPSSKRNLIIRYIAKEKFAEREARLKEQATENSRYAEQEATRLRHAQGVEKMRAEGGVSFIYDEPHKFERYHDQRERRLKEIEGKYRYEWQKYAPRHVWIDETLPTDVAASTDLHNPFGIKVEKIKVPCFRCGQVGHVYSDSHCPMFGMSITDEEKKRRGKQFFIIEVEPDRLNRLVDDFNSTYNEYHNVEYGKKLGYISKQVRLKNQVVNELTMSSDIDPAGSYKTEDEEYLSKLDPKEREVLFKVIRRMIRDKKRIERQNLIKKGKIQDAKDMEISDDSDDEGDLAFAQSKVENEVTEVLDEIVFGRDTGPLKSFQMEKYETICVQVFESLKKTQPYEDFVVEEENLRKKLTESRAQDIIRKKKSKLEKADPLADALMVYVAEGRTKEDIEKSMKKLEEEKKEAIEARISKKRARHEAEVKKLEEQVLKEDLSRALFKEPESKIELTKETLTLRELQEKRQSGIEAIQKIKCIKEKLLELDQKILMEEKERKFGKIAKLEMDNSRTSEEQELRQRIEGRKNEAEKEQRRKEREDKRRLRKMNKKLEKLKERDEIDRLGYSELDSSKRLPACPTLARHSENQKPIKVITKTIPKLPKLRPDPTMPMIRGLEEGEIPENQESVPKTTDKVEFETVVKGKKQKIDSDFLSKFGIKID